MNNGVMKNGLCFIGSDGLFSLTALQTLLARQIHIHHIILAGYAPATTPDRSLPISTPAALADVMAKNNMAEDDIVEKTAPTIPALAAQHRIPIHYAGHDIQHFDSWPDVPSFIHHGRPELLFVACFPFRLPAAIRRWPAQLAINLHPSLLPAYRGPNPIFWQLRNGERHTGISLHLLTESLDAGPILFQKRVSLPQGASPDELDTLLVQQGTEALCDLISAQTLQPHEQDPQTATYQPLPTLADYELDTRWSAQRAYNFMRGTRNPFGRYPILLDGQRHYLHTALSFDENRSLSSSYTRDISLPDSQQTVQNRFQTHEELSIQFSPGVLRAKPV